MTTVVNSPEVSIARILKPFSGFEDKYQGVLANTPIAFPGGVDSMAGKEGYDPHLAKGVPVPAGSKVFLWLPRGGGGTYSSAFNVPYSYTLIWRLRSLFDANADPTALLASNLGQRQFGRPQAASFNPDVNQEGPRYMIPAAIESIRVNERITQQVPYVESEDLQNVLKLYSSGGFESPLTPDYPGPVGGSPKVGVVGCISQGQFAGGNGTPTPADMNAGVGCAPLYVVHETVAKGNELIVLVNREIPDPSNPTAADLWDFAGQDAFLSNYYGNSNGTEPVNPALGIYLLTGSL